MWKTYFKLIKIKPGKVVVPGHGKIDFNSDKLPVELCRKLCESGFPYLEMTKEGKEKFSKAEPEKKQNKPDQQDKQKSPVTA